jgi:hypothetical protein
MLVEIDRTRAGIKKTISNNMHDMVVE